MQLSFQTCRQGSVNLTARKSIGAILLLKLSIDGTIAYNAIINKLLHRPKILTRKIRLYGTNRF